jgi:hypothetical protein
MINNYDINNYNINIINMIKCLFFKNFKKFVYDLLMIYRDLGH